MKNLIKQQKLSEKQIQESGIVFIICLLIIDHFVYPIPFVFTLFLLFIVLIKPLFYKPFAIAWFFLAEMLGSQVPKIILTIVFYLIVCPVGMIINLFKENQMRLSRKQMESKSTAFISREHKYTIADIEKPF